MINLQYIIHHQRCDWSGGDPSRPLDGCVSPAGDFLCLFLCFSCLRFVLVFRLVFLLWLGLAGQENTLELATLLALCRSLVLCYVMFMIMWLNMLEWIIAHLSRPRSIGWVALSFLVQLSVRLSRYGNIRPNIYFFNIYRQKSLVIT